MNDLSTRVPNGWAAVRLGDIAEINMGQSPPGSSYTSDPSLGTSFLQGNAEFGDRYPTPVKGTTEPRKLANERSVLISVRAPVGDTNFSPGRVAIGRGLAAITPLGGVRREFLFWLLRASRERLEAQGTGTTFKAIPKATLQDMPVLLPPLPEQDRIVEAVEAAMAAIAEVERAFDAAERSLALLELSAMHQVFQSRSGSRWQTRPLGDVADHALGKMLDREKNEGIPRPYLRNVNVQWGRITLDDVKEMRIRDSEVERYRVRRGDLLVCEGGEPGRCAIWEHDEPMFFQKALHRIRPSEELDTSFLAVYLRYLALTGGLDVHLTGSTIKHLPGQRLARIPIPLPPLKEQRDIVHQLQRQRELLDTSRKYLEQVGKRLGAFRQSVLRQAFSGRLVLQDETDEPAGRLLQRLRAEKAERPGAMKLPRPPRQDARSRGLRNRAASASGVTNRD